MEPCSLLCCLAGYPPPPTWAAHAVSGAYLAEVADVWISWLDHRIEVSLAHPGCNAGHGVAWLSHILKAGAVKAQSTIGRP